MGIRIKTLDEAFSLKHNGEHLKVTVDTHGLQTRYRGEFVYGINKEKLSQGLARIDRDADAKAKRAAALKEASANPVPAVFAGDDGTVVDIGVRGIDQRSGEVLITVQGSKDRRPRKTVLRSLSAEERETLERLGRELRETRRGRMSAPPIYTAARDLPDAEVEISYDPGSDDYVGVFDGQEYRAESPRALANAIERTLVVRDYPYTLDDDDNVIEASTTDRHNSLFKTREEAEGYVTAKRRADEAHAAYTALRASLRFDFSRFEESEEE